MRIASLLAATALVFGVAHAASANVIYSVSGVSLSSLPSGGTSAGTLTGTFTTNDALSAVVAFDITASATGSFAGFHYTSSNSSVTAATLPSQYFRIDSTGNLNELQLFFTAGLSSAGGALAPANSYEHEPSGGNRYLVGAVTPVPTPTGVPEPATLAVLGAGLAGAGLLRRRRSA